MKETYQEAIKQVMLHEGGYSNHPSDPGGPTNWGITIADARTYWKQNATANDVKAMPIEVAYDIYRKRYADALQYDKLPAGVDYAILDYGINSGISRAAKVLQRFVKVSPVDGKIGLVTLTATSKADATRLINAIFDERLRFLRQLKTWSVFGPGWSRRCREGRALALKLAKRYPKKPKVDAPRPDLSPSDIAPIDPEVIEGSNTATDGGAKAIPEEPEINPPVKSKTIWGGILGYLTGAAAMISAVFEHLNNKYALMAFVAAAVVGSIALFLIVKGRIDIGKVAEALKDEE